MSEKVTILYDPNEVGGRSLGKELDKAEKTLTQRLRSLVEQEEYESKYQEGYFQRETHSKKGEHIFLVYNNHLANKSDISPQCFIQVLLPGHSKTKPKMEDYKWTIEQNPAALYPDKLARIESLMELFEPAVEDSSGEA